MRAMSAAPVRLPKQPRTRERGPEHISA
jgi:hypothetical protein